MVMPALGGGLKGVSSVEKGVPKLGKVCNAKIKERYLLGFLFSFSTMFCFSARVLNRLAAPGDGTWLIAGSASAARTVLVQMHRT